MWASLSGTTRSIPCLKGMRHEEPNQLWPGRGDGTCRTSDLRLFFNRFRQCHVPGVCKLWLLLPILLASLLLPAGLLAPTRLSSTCLSTTASGTANRNTAAGTACDTACNRSFPATYLQGTIYTTVIQSVYATFRQGIGRSAKKHAAANTDEAKIDFDHECVAGSGGAHHPTCNTR